MEGSSSERVRSNANQEWKNWREERSKKKHLDIVSKEDHQSNESQDSLEFLQNKVKTIEESTKRLQRKIKDVENRNKTLAGNAEINLEQNRNLEEQNRELEETNAELKQRIKDLQGKNRLILKRKNSLEKVYVTLEESIKDYKELEEEKSRCENHILQLQNELQAVREKNVSLSLERNELHMAPDNIQEEIKRNDTQTECETLQEEKLQLEKELAVMSEKVQRVEDVFGKFKTQCGVTNSNPLEIFSLISDLISSRFSTLDNFCNTLELLNDTKQGETSMAPPTRTSLEKEVKNNEKRGRRDDFEKRETQLQMEQQQLVESKKSLETLSKYLKEKASILSMLSRIHQEQDHEKFSHLQEKIATLKHQMNRKNRSERSLEQEIVQLTGEKRALEDEKGNLLQSNHFMQQEICQLQEKATAIAELILSIDSVGEKFRSECEPGERFRTGRNTLTLFTFITGVISDRFSSLDEFVEKTKQFDPEPQNKCKMLPELKLHLETKVAALTREKLEQEHKVAELNEEKRQLQENVDYIASNLLQQQVEVETLTEEKTRFEVILETFRTNCEIGRDYGTTALELFEFITNFISLRFPSLNTFCDSLEAMCRLETKQPPSTSKQKENAESPMNASVESQSRKRPISEEVGEGTCSMKLPKEDAVVAGHGTSVDKGPPISFPFEVQKIIYVNSDEDVCVD